MSVRVCVTIILLIDAVEYMKGKGRAEQGATHLISPQDWTLARHSAVAEPVFVSLWLPPGVSLDRRSHLQLPRYRWIQLSHVVVVTYSLSWTNSVLFLRYSGVDRRNFSCHGW